MEINFFPHQNTNLILSDAKSGLNQLANSAAAFTEKSKAEGKAKQGKRKAAMQSLCLNEPKKARRLTSNLRLIISPKIYLGILNRKAKAGEEQAKEALKTKAVKAERVSERAEKAKVIKMEPE